MVTRQEMAANLVKMVGHILDGRVANLRLHFKEVDRLGGKVKLPGRIVGGRCFDDLARDMSGKSFFAAEDASRVCDLLSFSQLYGERGCIRVWRSDELKVGALYFWGCHSN